MQTDRNSGIAKLIERTLRDRIVSGELAPETPLRQDHIAREFEVSIVPVREALRRLESAGLVAFQPRRGAVVAPVSADDLWDILEMRAGLEALALREAIRRRTPETLARLRAAVPAGEVASDPREWIPENRAFHRALCEPCGRQRLLALIESLVLAGDRYVLIAARAPADMGEGSQREHVEAYPLAMRAHHRAILAEVEAGRTAAAVRALRQDLLGGGRGSVVDVAEGADAQRFAGRPAAGLVDARSGRL